MHVTQHVPSPNMETRLCFFGNDPIHPKLLCVVLLTPLCANTGVGKAVAAIQAGQEAMQAAFDAMQADQNTTQAAVTAMQDNIETLLEKTFQTELRSELESRSISRVIAAGRHAANEYTVLLGLVSVSFIFMAIFMAMFSKTL